ncbi:hypothetical protein TNCV_3822581 [Trichonephila clavipes]|nr:hypothetical protein TNCV_3822581 [Trichonephila clavipes]
MSSSLSALKHHLEGLMPVNLSRVNVVLLVRCGNLEKSASSGVVLVIWPSLKITRPIANNPRAILWTAMAGSDVVQSGRPIFDDIFQHLWPYIGNNTENVVFQIVKRLWHIRIDQ